MNYNAAMANVGTNDPRWPRLMGLAVHELRTPLSVVSGYLKMFGRFGPLTEQQQKILQDTEKSAAKLASVVAEMSELVNLEEGKAKFNRGRIELAPLVAEVIASLEPVPDREIRVTLNSDAPGAAVQGDPVRLKTAIRAVLWALRRELVTSTELVAHLRLDADAGQRLLRLTIADDRRVAALAAEPLTGFDRFFEWRGGCGLSLAIASRIVAAHDGRVLSPPGNPDGMTAGDSIERIEKAGAVIVLPAP